MINKRINCSLKILLNIVLLSLGIILVLRANMVLSFLYLVLLIGLSILTIIELLAIYTDKINYKIHIFYFLVYFLLLILIINYKALYIRFIGYVVAIYALINGIIFFIEYHIRRKNHLKGLFTKLLLAIVFLIYALILFIIPMDMTSTIFILSGIYLIFYGLYDLLYIVYNALSKKHHIVNIGLPVLLSSIIPVRIFMKIDKDEQLNQLYDNNPDDDNDIAPLEVNIYIQAKGFESIGHVDISVNGTIYSYGLHDPKARYLFGSAGDGVLVKVDRNTFLKNCLKSGKTMIINFKLHPSQSEMEVIEKRVNELLDNTYEFSCDNKLLEEKGLAMDAKDYISDVYLDTHCDLYKFKRGKFKTYFVFTTNCVLLADYLIRNKDINLLGMDGIVTPGNYLYYLYNLYLNGGIVKGIKIYKLKK